ncbi:MULTISPECIES: bifunctional methylenetetrahydrofolate dehydrogenase/methenyltetrahydrofolate cyclohydrolase FolD [unclassified Chitinophaga]|uniref:bifunctional methylenetetrahydrofolate dehydrogenase/methenyltetrahydrofolate cyclohydrolase FolD n=1 Tax=unclassified Chitinophaga TaxID=2619133 RepID=UPI0009C7216B|nr:MULTISPECIES: bifunctional methylenetetrahydrofolate dehydrogenase/methenyltetrahydrofolate cyclohydrolase FolD [unclassified Chitinophaga]OMP77168.1 bifunctional 5,10-methylene-tetrahydrofolate dehydrogenase/5,10-methylene-tetrahydrofolate cyclohydrolase [[Flexibacter] sp. ATCC 35208]WPV67346.1 bifunctional methylenetetrahydrofolate dehydrogenase/methenyltetrahydrofolate cyclohydrolase FolD [Chitinophaga sp. LS1]
MQILDGKLVSAAIKAQLAEKVTELKALGKKVPHLAAILVGNDPASETYVASKVKSCAEIGYNSTLLRFDEKISEKHLLDNITLLNENADIDGILVQLPLPKHINEEVVINNIDPSKDVDGFHPVNVGKMVSGLPTFIPATPYGIMLMLEHYKVPTKGKHAVVIGRSHIVGTPMSILLSRNTYPGNCTVTLTHSQTANLKEICLQADIIVAAIGRPNFVTADMVKEGAAIVDVGINRIADPSKKSGHRLVGDVNFDEVAEKCSYITPVPGGVGPMTIAALLKNTYHAAVGQKGNMN